MVKSIAKKTDFAHSLEINFVAYFRLVKFYVQFAFEFNFFYEEGACPLKSTWFYEINCSHLIFNRFPSRYVSSRFRIVQNSCNTCPFCWWLEIHFAANCSKLPNSNFSKFCLNCLDEQIEFYSLKSVWLYETNCSRLLFNKFPAISVQFKVISW